MSLISAQPNPIVREAIPQVRLRRFRRIVEIFGWKVIPFNQFQRKLQTIALTRSFNLMWLHTFFEVYATPLEKQEMLEAGYHPRS